MVKDSTPPAIVYGLLQSLYHPANRATLAEAGPPANRIALSEALKGIAVPLHPGAERFYREKGLLKKMRYTDVHRQ